MNQVSVVELLDKYWKWPIQPYHEELGVDTITFDMLKYAGKAIPNYQSSYASQRSQEQAEPRKEKLQGKKGSTRS